MEAAQPFPPESDGTAPESFQRITVARDPVVREVAPEFLTQCSVLIRQRLLASLAEPLHSAVSPRHNRPLDVVRFTTLFPLWERAQKCVKPGMSKVPGGVRASTLASCGAPLGRSNGTSRVFAAGCPGRPAPSPRRRAPPGFCVKGFEMAAIFASSPRSRTGGWGPSSDPGGHSASGEPGSEDGPPATRPAVMSSGRGRRAVGRPPRWPTRRSGRRRCRSA